MTDKPIGNPWRWGFRVGQNAARSRADRPETLAPDKLGKMTTEQVPGRVDPRVLWHQVAARRQKLTSIQWRPFETIRVYGGVDEAARVLGLLPSSVKKTFLRGLARLREEPEAPRPPETEG